MERVQGENLKGLLTLVRKVFPDYRGRKVYISRFVRPITLHTWWEGGRRSEYVLIEEGRVSKTRVPYHPLFDGGTAVPPKFELPHGAILVERVRGADQYVVVHVRPEDWQLVAVASGNPGPEGA